MTRIQSCDLCEASDFEPYLEEVSCGRRLDRCRACGLVVALREAELLATRGVAADRRAAEPTPRYARTGLRRASAVARLLPAGRVLEIGCADGSCLSGLDPAQHEVVTVTHEMGAMSALASESFDLVALFGSLGRAASPRATCMEVTRLLRSGGQAVIETPSLSSLTALLCGTRWRPLRDPSSDYFFTPATLERLLSVCGLARGVSRLPLLAAWPAPGTLVVVARKSSVLVKAPSLADLTSKVGRIAPIGAS